MKFVSLAFLLSLFLGSVSARSTGAGGCSIGSASPAVGHGGSSTGSLSNGNYIIQVDGQTVTTAAAVTAGIPFNVTISGPTFIGFLVILPGEPTSSIEEFGTGGQLATMGSCNGLAAATHVNADVDKTSVTVQAVVDSAKMTTLELNIVVEKEIYYYTQVTLTVVASASEPTMAPVQSPSTSPSAVPSDAPVDNNGSTPVEPTAAPIQSPSTSPSTLPSSSPVKDDDNGSSSGGSSCRASSLRLFCKG